MKKTLGIVFIILIFILGYLSIGILSFYGMRSYYAYEGYCSEKKLPNFVSIEIYEVLIICSLISYAIFLETFHSFKKYLQFYKVMFVFLIINSIFLVYKIIEYPIVLEAKLSGWSDNPQNNLQMMYNPLIMFFSIYSSTIIWINFRFQKKTQSLKNISIFFLIVVIIASIVISIASQSIEYKDCRG